MDERFIGRYEQWIGVFSVEKTKCSKLKCHKYCVLLACFYEMYKTYFEQ